MNPVLHIDIREETLKNKFYRRVISTTPYSQVVLMSLNPGEEIDLELHEFVTQFIRVEQGNGVVIINNRRFSLEDDTAIVIPSNSWHYVKNEGSMPMKLYTIYSPPNHPAGTIDKTKADESRRLAGKVDNDVKQIILEEIEERREAGIFNY